jgi:uncharacterized membrane protein
MAKKKDIPEDDAPLRARRDDKEDDLVHVGRTVLVNRPRQELYAFWRDFQNLPQFMTSIETIQPTGGSRAVWMIKAPAGQTVDVETEVTEDVAGALIAWRSVEGSDIKTAGRVTFADAPAGRGTVVSVDIGYDPPAGAIGHVVAKLFAAEPNIQARHELKRFKMLMETGEIATGANRHEQEK